MGSSILLKRFFTYLAFIFIFYTPAQAITISPATQIIETEPGIAKTFTIKVLNDGNTKASFDCYLADFEINKKGGKVFKPAGSTSHSVAKYISIAEPTKFILNAHELKDVSFTINVPKGIIGGNKAIAFIQAQPVDDNSKGKKLIMSVRAGAMILHETIGTVDIRSKIKSVDIIQPTKINPLAIKLKVRNEGNTHIISSAKVVILGSNDSFAGSMDLKKTLIFPGREAVLQGQLPNDISPGIYHALITYQYRDKNVSIDKVFTVK